MKKTLLAIGVLLAVAIACQVNEADTTLETPETAPVSVDLNPIFIEVEQPAAFPGGKTAWKAFLEQNLVIPESDPQGKVFVSFIVDKEGAIHDIQLIRGIGSGADEAVVELLKKSPNWEAGKQRGKEVNVRMGLAVKFGEAEKDLQPTQASTLQITEDMNAGFDEIFLEVEDMNAGFDEVFLVVEDPSTFSGGTKAWKTYLKDNLRSPDSDVKGKVFVSFIVDKEGGLHNIQLLRGIGGGADEIALELLKNSPNWIAGKQRGIAVDSRMQIAIQFK